MGAICQGLSMLLISGLAAWLSHWTISKLNWNKVLAVIVAVMLGVVLGLVMSFLSTVVSIPIAGIQ
jgi:ABC-type xylose transport system permease subunit